MLSLNDIRVKHLKKILKKVNRLQDAMAKKTDIDLQAQTGRLKNLLAQGASLDSILPEAFATIREADRRVLGKFPFDVQVLGGIVLHQGNIAEMKTGEGKTLTATLPVYLNALTGKGVMVVTTNSYLATRDAEELRVVYEWLGLTVGVGVQVDPDEHFKAEEKQVIYNSDIIYTTNDGIGFDYLQNNLADSVEKQYLREFNYAIIDEVDAVLLDAAQMPLIISGSPRVQSNLFKLADDFVATLEEDEAYELDEERKHVWLTKKGIAEARIFFNIPDFFSEKNYMLVKHIQLALHAKALFKRNQDYVVEDGEVKLLDAKNGRILPSTKMQLGLHQAVEAKEQVKITDQTRAMASITYQNLFRMFHKLAGMTGTGKHDEEEFIQTYNMSVVVIPTNRPIRRQDLPDKIYTTLPEKLYASMALVEACHDKQQPILLTTGSVELSEIYSQMLLKAGIPHNVLNAKNVAREAQIISEAGQLGAVTVATMMAGRGTDIKLGQGVAELGGLAVIGTERMTSKRIDLQLRGRAGRQGDPGFSQFFVSLEDDIVVERGLKRTKQFYKKHANDFDIRRPRELKKRRFKRIVDQAQLTEESQNRESRLSTLEFDESGRIQREIVYETRNQLLAENHAMDQKILAIADRAITKFLDSQDKLTARQTIRFILDNMNYNLKYSDEVLKSSQRHHLKANLLAMVDNELAIKRQHAMSEEQLIQFQRLSMLKAIDSCWVEQVDHLQQLRAIVMNRRFIQKNPIYEYQKESVIAYDMMKNRLDLMILKNIMLSTFEETEDGSLTVSFP
ncbi:accessory Sec system translocase SecA2 [Leuconostoc holzapfelii]|uniref:Protein translocase subunit SecA n=1 Tax=Leuconostoc holzapfelii TaxID=434464 RepID=A0A846ZGR6_9LACO|nr:accessory Sec system translocase SecA2 [Leuconostoc holzapfelii]